VIKGDSTGFAPIQVRINAELKKIKIINFLNGLNFLDLIFLLKIGIKYKIAIAIINEITPPILFGIERRIA
jgi:hypothetical protein